MKEFSQFSLLDDEDVKYSSGTKSALNSKSNTSDGIEETQHNAVKEEIKTWPAWKKEAYNANFAASNHSIKV